MARKNNNGPFGGFGFLIILALPFIFINSLLDSFGYGKKRRR